MNIRAMLPEDLPKLYEIHQEFYKEEFPFPDFSRNFLCCFVVIDDNGDIISAGGIKPIVESIVITDKRQSVRNRREALYDILSASSYLSQKQGFFQIHAFIQEEGWENQLRKIGFEDTKGKALVLSL